MAATTATSTALTPQPSGPGFGWRVGVSVISVFGWVIFILLYFAFWADHYTGLQSAVIIIVSILAFIAMNGAAWASWGVQQARIPKV